MSISETIRSVASRFFICGNITRPYIPNRVNLIYWKAEDGRDNVGDLLSKVLFDFIIGQKGLRTRGLFRRISLIGSILSFIGGGKTTVYGTGLMDEDAARSLIKKHKHVTLDIRAVRGPLTRTALMKIGMEAPPIYGDPAILMPLFYKSKSMRIPGKTVIIPHFSRYDKYLHHYDNVISTITSDWKGFIDEICSAEKVISSSLHGIILAESYGVPAIMLADVPGSNFKYADYYLSTGCDKWPMANSIEEGMTMDGRINHNLSEMQSRLLDVFPTDIFK